MFQKQNITPEAFTPILSDLWPRRSQPQAQHPYAVAPKTGCYIYIVGVGGATHLLCGGILFSGPTTANFFRGKDENVFARFWPLVVGTGMCHAPQGLSAFKTCPTNDSKATVSVLYWYGNYPTMTGPSGSDFLEPGWALAPGQLLEAQG